MQSPLLRRIDTDAPRMASKKLKLRMDHSAHAPFLDFAIHRQRVCGIRTAPFKTPCLPGATSSSALQVRSEPRPKDGHGRQTIAERQDQNHPGGAHCGEEATGARMTSILGRRA